MSGKQLLVEISLDGTYAYLLNDLAQGGGRQLRDEADITAKNFEAAGLPVLSIPLDEVDATKLCGAFDPELSAVVTLAADPAINTPAMQILIRNGEITYFSVNYVGEFKWPFDWYDIPAPAYCRLFDLEDLLYLDPEYEATLDFIGSLIPGYRGES